MERTIKSKATNEKELKAELIAISKKNPEKWYNFSAIFGSVTILETEKHPSTATSENCYRTFGGFFKNGQIVKPHSNWIKQFNRIPCRG